MSIKRKLILITFAFSLIILSLIGINYFAMNTLSTIRAYVGGEGFWSKAQKEAIYSLTKYTVSHRKADYLSFQENLVVPLSDRLARLELQKKSTDFSVAETEFIRAKNHPDDVRSMGYLFKTFFWQSHVKQTIRIWTLADADIEKIQMIASEIHELVLKDKLTPELTKQYLIRIDELNKDVTDLESQFSYTLGAAARWLTSVLLYTTIAMTILGLFFALSISIIIERDIFKSVEALKQGTVRIEQGDLTTPITINDRLDSKDELNQLAISFNKMTESLMKTTAERDIANERLKDRARQLSETQKLVHLGSWEWDITKDEISASEEFFHIFEINSGVIKNVLERVHPADRSLLRKAVQDALMDKKSFSCDHSIVMDNGDIHKIYTQGLPIENESGEIIKIIGSSQDITERHKIQSQMIHSNKMASLGEMASGIAHEINNPLTIIKFASYQLQKNIENEKFDSTDVKNTLTKIDATTDRISKIVLGLRTFSRDGKNDPFELIHVNALLDNILSFCSDRLKINSIDLIKENIHEEMIFEGRQIEISRVLLNLFNNAIDAIESADERWIKISAKNEKDYLEIEVTDSGKGIPLEIQNKIFQPFFTSKEIGKGTGLGLSLSMAIIKNHNGELSLNTKNENTTFVIKLPKKQQEAVVLS